MILKGVTISKLNISKSKDENSRHQHAARHAQPPPRRLWRHDGYEKLSVNPVPLIDARLPRGRPGRACQGRLGQRMELGEKHGYRNAQATVIAPTGTIGLVMDCDTTGIEPDFALVKFKKLAGGGYFKIINRAVPEALRTLGYSESQIAEIEAYAVGHGNLNQAPGVNPGSLQGQGLHRREDRGAQRRAEVGLRHQVRLQPVDARRRLPQGRARLHRRAAQRLSLRHAAALGFTQEGHRGRQHPCLRRDDAGRRAVPQGRAPAGVRLRQPVRQDRQALPLGRKPHPHDGGGPALHLGRDLQDHQHAERGDRRGLQGTPTCCPGSWR